MTISFFVHHCSLPYSHITRLLPHFKVGLVVFGILTFLIDLACRSWGFDNHLHLDTTIILNFDCDCLVVIFFGTHFVTQTNNFTTQWLSQLRLRNIDPIGGCPQIIYLTISLLMIYPRISFINQLLVLFYPKTSLVAYWAY